MEDYIEQDGFEEETQDEPQEEQRIPPEQFVESVYNSQNIAADMDADELTKIGKDALESYELDKGSMAEWLEMAKRGIELAKMVKEEKGYPFPKAANIKYPLIATAATQFNARAYPAIVPAENPVKAKTYGEDSNGEKASRGDRVASHMSWQLYEQIDEWEAETDKLLIQLPIVGEMFRKVWYDTVLGRPRCRVLEPGKFIVNDRVKNLEEAPRLTEELTKYPYEIKSNITAGIYLAFEYGDGEDADDDQSEHQFIEQHTLLDLDDDEYPEPYVVTVHVETMQVVRIVADFSPQDVQFTKEEIMVPTPVTDEFGQVVAYQNLPQEITTGITSITRGSYFVNYQFMPSMDGGFHGTGLGVLLGDISESVNSIINMLLDAGHMASLGGGFIGSEFRLKGGNNRFRPGEWKTVATKGMDVRNAIVPMTFPGPDNTLFQMLGMLIEAGREIASVKDIMTGDTGGQVQTATTTIALIEQGMMVFTAVYKRVHRALKREFKMLAKINAQTVTPEEYNQFLDGTQQGQPAQFDPQEDYSAFDMNIVPVADPNSVTKMQEMAKANIVMQMADQGLVDKAEAAERILEAASIDGREELAVKPNKVEEQMTEMNMAMAQASLAQAQADIQLTIAKVRESMASAFKDVSGVEQEQRKSAFDETLKTLEASREGLDRAIQGGAGRMAGQPNNPANAQPR